MGWLVFTDYDDVLTFLEEVDDLFGYPEPLEDLHHVGRGPWAPKELGRAPRYSGVIQHPTQNKWALWNEGMITSHGHVPLEVPRVPGHANRAKIRDAVTLPPGTSEHEVLPPGWFPEPELP